MVFFSVKDENNGGRTLWGHTSHLDEEKQEKLKQISDQLPRWQNTFTFFTFYGMMEAVNRIKPLKTQNIYTRVGLVLVPALFARFVVAPQVFWSSNRAAMDQQLVGAPLWAKKIDVPELDKMYFFLDDDNNYEPNLMHHGRTNSIKYDAIFKLRD